MIKTQYKEQIKTIDKEKSLLKGKSRFFLIGKLAAFSLAAIFAYFTFNHPTGLNITFIIFFGVLYILFCIIDTKCLNAINSCNARIKVCENEISYLDYDFSPFDEGNEYLDPKHEFSYDLDIFGKNSLFNRINRTITKGGKNLLAYRLSHPENEKRKIIDTEEAVKDLKGQNEWRIKFMSNNSIQGDTSSLKRKEKKSKIKNLLFISNIPYLLVFITIASLIFCSLGMLPWRAFTSMFLLQCFISIIVNKTTSGASTNIDQVHKEYRGYLNVLNDISQLKASSPRLRLLKAKLFDKENNSLEAFKKLSKLLNMFDQRGNIIMYVILNGTFLFDLILTRKFIKWGEKYGPYIEQWINCISDIDVLTSFATYAYNNPHNHYAEILENNNENIIEATEVYHPFLRQNKAIPNSFILRKKNIAIVTGANMAGKSTFLRTIGITYILASNGIPVCAKAFRFQPVTLFSSMRTSDDLANDVSYFNAELLRLKQLIEHVKANPYTLIILDEILKGTNSKDKLKGSIMFLNEISKFNVSAIIATHDLELSKLEEEYKNVYTNYCFEIELSENINYTYKIQKGVAQNLNASYLLANILKEISA